MATSSFGHREIFLMYNGPPPWPCYFCKESVRISGSSSLSLIVHHRDHVRSNNHRGNLKASHRCCHQRHHNGSRDTAFMRTPAYRQTMREALSGRTITAEHAAKISTANLGKKFSDKTRMKMSTSARRRWARERGEE